MEGEIKTNEIKDSDVIVINKQYVELTEEELKQKENKLLLSIKIYQCENGQVAIKISACAYDDFTSKVFVKRYGDVKGDDYRVRRWDDANERYEDAGKDEELDNYAVFYCKKSEAFQKLKEIIKQIKQEREKARANKFETQYLTVML